MEGEQTRGATPGHLILLCGLPGAGKTTLAHDLAPRIGALHLCPDEWFIRLDLDPHDSELRNRFERLQWQQAQTLLTLGTSVIVENGLWLRAHRDEKRTGARQLGASVSLVVLDVPVDERWRRIQVRNAESGAVPITWDQLSAFDSRWQPPTPEERELYDPSP